MAGVVLYTSKTNHVVYESITSEERSNVNNRAAHCFSLSLVFIFSIHSGSHKIEIQTHLTLYFEVEPELGFFLFFSR